MRADLRFDAQLLCEDTPAGLAVEVEQLLEGRCVTVDASDGVRYTVSVDHVTRRPAPGEPERTVDPAELGTDASRWAQAFLKRNPLDEGTILAWFANAIEAGREAGLPSPVEAGLPAPPATAAVALASLAVHAQEALSVDGHPVDRVAIQGCLDAPGVAGYLAELQERALLPVPREPREAATPPADAAGGPGSRVERASR